MAPEAIANAKGLIILKIGKAGASFTIRGGSGIVISRLPDGTWSAPSAIKTGGFGFGSQFGAEIIELVMVLSSEEALKNFFEKENITLGGNISAAIGELGRAAEIGTPVKNISTIFSYGRSRGAYLGMSFEGAIIQQNNEANTSFYGKGVTVEDILAGKVPKPDFANELYALLNKVEEVARLAKINRDIVVTPNRAIETNEKSGTNVSHEEQQPLIQPEVTQVQRDEKKPLL
jgi:lipid-binding SYLF domain-containing protein